MKPGETAAPPPIRRAAEEWLHLAPDATPEATREALLRRLGAENFRLDPLGHEAALVLTGRATGPAPLLTEAGTTEGRELSRRVEAFAADFFATPVAARRATWMTLWQASAGDHRLRDRLRGLEPGLLVAPPTSADRTPLVERLAADVRELFVLTPGAAAPLARAKLWALQQDPAVTLAVRNRASRDLSRRHPALAALTPGYVAMLGQTWRVPLLRRWRRRVARQAGGDFVVGIKTYGPWLVAMVLFTFINSLSARGPQPIPRPFVANPTAPWPVPGGAAVARREDLWAGFINRLGGELRMLDLPLPAAELDRITAELPWRDGNPTAGAMTLALSTGIWGRQEVDALAGALRRGLARARRDLKPEQIDRIVPILVRALVPKSRAVVP